MRTTLNRLLLLVGLIAALFIMASHTSPLVSTEVCDENFPALKEAVSTPLWESLSHQFVSAMPY